MEHGRSIETCHNQLSRHRCIEAHGTQTEAYSMDNYIRATANVPHVLHILHSSAAAIRNDAMTLRSQ